MSICRIRLLSTSKEFINYNKRNIRIKNEKFMSILMYIYELKI